ncbi:hypothetical protein [Microbulbifer sp. SAOS-129_SWC]|uniref:tetratricopeptide repeat protein n=1 Tax=Microbulbifer sp. SAOS-129_SWC TaxID=3145235 RepID=UPI003217EA3C
MLKMRVFFYFLFLIFSALAQAKDMSCEDWVRSFEEAYKFAHTYKPCIDAARAGDTAAQYQLGMSYGFANEPEKSLHWYLESAKSGQTASYLGLGNFYFYEGQSSYQKAVKWYLMHVKAKAQGYEVSCSMLGRIYQEVGDFTGSLQYKKLCSSQEIKK